jgi:hypothetical protein
MQGGKEPTLCTVESFRGEDELLSQLHGIESPNIPPEPKQQQLQPAPGPAPAAIASGDSASAAGILRKMYNQKPALRATSPKFGSRPTTADSQDSLSQLSKQVNIATKALITTVSSTCPEGCKNILSSLGNHAHAKLQKPSQVLYPLNESARIRNLAKTNISSDKAPQFCATAVQ